MPDTTPAFAPEDLTRLTVKLTPRAVEALNEAAVRLGDGKTGTVNRALILYSKLTRLEIGDGLLVARRAGEPARYARVPFERRHGWLLGWALFSRWTSRRTQWPEAEPAETDGAAA